MEIRCFPVGSVVAKLSLKFNKTRGICRGPIDSDTNSSDCKIGKVFPKAILARLKGES